MEYNKRVLLLLETIARSINTIEEREKDIQVKLDINQLNVEKEQKTIANIKKAYKKGGQDMCLVKAMSKETESSLSNIIIGYAQQHGMTASNVKDVCERVVKFMEDNAVLEKQEM